jgi:hypothetical protein
MGTNTRQVLFNVSIRFKRNGYKAKNFFACYSKSLMPGPSFSMSICGHIDYKITVSVHWPKLNAVGGLRFGRTFQKIISLSRE